jgi:hypothetical protein
MKKLGFVSAIFGAALLSMTPASLQFSSDNGALFSVSVSTAKAAELEVPAYQRRYAHRRHYRVASWDKYCGGPYVGAGWHGGSYWGGPWMDLSCYGYY